MAEWVHLWAGGIGFIVVAVIMGCAMWNHLEK